MSSNPRFWRSLESMTLAQIAEALFSRFQDLGYAPPGQPYAFHEYGAYVGPVAAGLATVAVWTRGRAAMPWLLLAAIGIGLAAGSALGGDLSPWALLHRLPLFASLRLPSRFLLVTVLAVGVLAGMGVEAITRRGGRLRIAAAMALLAIATVDAALVGPHNLRYASTQRPDPLPTAPAFVPFRARGDTRMYPVARANMGALVCYEPLKPVTSVLAMGDAGYRGEHYLLNGGTVTLVEWSPHRLVLDVVSEGPNLLVVNQNHHASWRVEGGRGTVAAHNGLLGVSVPQGAQRLTLEYVSARFSTGLALAGFALVVAAAAEVRRRQGRR
jgi:hypothetical protein